MIESTLRRNSGRDESIRARVRDVAKWGSVVIAGVSSEVQQHRVWSDGRGPSEDPARGVRDSEAGAGAGLVSIGHRG